MRDESDLQAALLTPRGRGAVATIGLRGAGAERLVGRFFQRPATDRSPSTLPLARILFGRWQRPEGDGEEIVVCRVSDTTIEIHCHGGDAASRAILTDLVDSGAAPISWQQWLAGERLACEAEWYALLAQTVSQRTAVILLDQIRGAFLDRIGELDDHVRSGRMEAAAESTDRLHQLSRVGRHLTRPWTVALVGPPNVGKSSLLNALVGFQRSLVYDQPGTTRDVVTTLAVFQGWPVELWDTAGLRGSEDPVEVEGTRRAAERARAADLVLLIAEPSRPDWQFIEPSGTQAPEQVRVLNKIDLAPEMTTSGALGTSALRELGIAALADAIVNRLVPLPPQPGEAVPVLERHVEMVSVLAESLNAGRRDHAQRMLEQLLMDLRT